MIALLLAVFLQRGPWITGTPDPPPPCAVERVFPGLRFEKLVDMEMMPGSDRLWVVELGGRVLSLPADGSRADLALDVKAHHPGAAMTYALTFHPKFAENRFVYLCYAEKEGIPDGSYVSRFTVARSDPPTIDVSSERVLLRWPAGGHNGCALKFGPDGMLYLCTGDAAPPDPPDPLKTGQDISDLLSSILRLDVDHAEGGRPYAIPKDNPFVNHPGARPEVFAYGLRNPWRMSFGPDGALYVGDVGWELWEMIHRVVPGGNYGWPLREGPNTSVRGDVTPGPTPVRPPLAVHPHSEAASITGGFHYRGRRMESLRGVYVYGDWETGKIWGLRHEGDAVTWRQELCDTTLRVIGFAEDADGELLVGDYGDSGGIYRLARNPAPAPSRPFPTKLSQTGLGAGVIPYEINARQWEDHAVARRWVGIPGEGAIRAGEKFIWEKTTGFAPKDTVFVKTLSMEMEAGRPESARKLETQILHFDGQTWRGYAYRWDKAQKDAELVDAGGTTIPLSVKDPAAPGGRREQAWRIAGRAECMRCHNMWGGFALGAYGDQIRGDVVRITKARRPLVDPRDASQPPGDRARAWLHANCAHCHGTGAGGSVLTLLEYEMELPKMRVVDQKPLRGDFGLRDARVVAPGDPYRSTLFYRISTEGAGHMPMIGSRLVDEEGVRLVRDWIVSLGKGVEPTKPSLEDPSGALALADSPDGPAAAEAAASHANPVVRGLFERFLPPEKRRRVLGPAFDPAVVLALKGDAARGQLLFHGEGLAQCARCHKAGGVGKAVGPDLAGVGKKYKAPDLLDQIVNPSKVMAPEFVMHTVETKDGLGYRGFVLRRTPAELVLRTEEGGDVTLKADETASDRPSAVSQMPEGMLAALTAQEAADLVAYLASQ